MVCDCPPYVPELHELKASILHWSYGRIYLGFLRRNKNFSTSYVWADCRSELLRHDGGVWLLM